MNRRHFVLQAGGALGAAACPRFSPAQAPESRRPPNILFILADDLGWGDLGCYGHPHIKTPHLDRLARQGSLFTQFYVNSPVCSPSRTAFMTGHYPARYRIHGHLAQPEMNRQRGMPNWLDPTAPFLPRLLQKAGYATAHFGKWHLGSGEGAPGPGAYGIDVHRTVNANGPTWEEKDSTFRAKSSAAIADETIRFIEKNAARPFYVNFWSLVPHATLNPTEEQMQPYRQFGPAGVPHKGATQIFYASVTDLDQQIGRVLARLDDLKLAQNTIVLFSSDNGPEEIQIRNASHSGVGSPGPFRGRKRSLYEGGVRLPFLARWPERVPAGKVNNTSVVTAVDFLATLARLAGVRQPDAYQPDGEDMSEVILGQQRPRSKAIFWEWRFPIIGHVLNQSPMLAVREGDWKLLLNPDRSRQELYNIPRDPSELNNQADRKPEIVERLAEKALAWQKTLPPGPVAPAAGKNNYRWPQG